MRRLLILALSTFLGGFALFWLAGVVLTDSLIFHPPSPGYTLADPYRSLDLPDGTAIVYRVWENPDTDRVMIYSHGNAEDLSNLDWVMPFYRDLGYTVVAWDYPGYGRSTGTPTVNGTTRALTALVQHLSERRNLEPSQVTLFGKSIGGGPSTAVAAAMPVGGLILESTFTSIFQVPLPYLRLPLDSFPNLRLIREIDCPLLVIHGTRDTVIEPIHGNRLYEAARDPKRVLWIDDAGHNDILLTAGDAYQQAIREFPDSVR